MAFEYIENWDSVEGKRSLLEQAEAGKLSLDAPVYQYFCQCKRKEPVVVNVRTIIHGLKIYNKHTRRRKCSDCYHAAVVKTAKAGSPLRNIASRPKLGPKARINRLKQTMYKGVENTALQHLEAPENKVPEAPATA
jgi:hypothetical protein